MSDQVPTFPQQGGAPGGVPPGGDNFQGQQGYAEGQAGFTGDQSTLPVLREQDRLLPIANISRIMKRAIPENGKMAKDSKECMQECCTEFIGFITSEASDRCTQEKRKTINGEDILWAMQSLGFDQYIEPLKMYLQAYRESIKGDRGLEAPNAPAAIMGADGQQQWQQQQVTYMSGGVAPVGGYQQ
ncbi:hypothetical protein SARC_03771 [Sphaeroforma arctica JP610]|uniref:Transcription factor CBF/NF-Y/archaeal histone domain-containing protein n=1 Tax=Sphaeroforma arctica JP610 TaxID=667725 RepID=A0A0L0G4P0_9EUKA|nr:hypothetical protein SARC_03771 [Sphaeroforma arctica JP610]KNC84010.1 hypothetical protein SARC_03771 [Sphaeroforma arctica JP610]|eukprot:XP_014157912.1 hypothetical protein SARC_03771 [Sphaeroforma arctica JP610]